MKRKVLVKLLIRFSHFISTGFFTLKAMQKRRAKIGFLNGAEKIED
jgi:hypothetical protein